MLPLYLATRIQDSCEKDKKLFGFEIFNKLPFTMNPEIAERFAGLSNAKASGVVDAFCIALYGALKPYLNEKYIINLFEEV